MDSVSLKLNEWGFGSLVETFQAQQIDEEAFLLLDREAIRALVPQIGLCLKLEKRISDYRQECQQKDETPTVVSVFDAGEEVAVGEIDHVLGVSQSLPLQQPSSSSQSTITTKFDVATAVMEHCEEIGQALISGNQISYLDKLTLNRVVVKHCLIAKCGVFPKSQEKELLAKELITAFPPLKGVDGTGYEQWFCKGIKNKDGKTTPNRGYIEENLRNFRQRLSAKDKEKYGIRQYNKGTKRSLQASNSNVDVEFVEFSMDSLEKQQWLKENSTPAVVVSQYMSETCVERHKYILKYKPSITDILELWPKLLLVDMIDQDFSLLYSQQSCGSLCKEFGLVARNLLLQAKNCGRSEAEKRALTFSTDIGELDSEKPIVSTAEINAALLLLPYLLPQGVVNSKKKKFRPTLEQTRKHFIEELPEGSTLLRLSAAEQQLTKAGHNRLLF